ncbi:high-affinity zinc uptake system binding-protein ZnuA [Clostridia bacterium]|nr:high-affinity zinc uptake system binding-protein ZnuA [Clostridia bacterium]
MKKIIKILCVLLTLAIGGCSAPSAQEKPKDSPEKPKKLSVVATIFPQYDFARQITGGLADVHMLLPPGAETHSFEPTPQDIIKIQNCDVFVYVGGDSDAWVERILASIDTSKMKVVTLMSLVDTVEEVAVEGMQEEEEEEEEGDAPEYDEHVWTSPKNAAEIVKELVGIISEKDPSNEETYRANADKYLAQLAELDETFKDIVSNSELHTLVFGDRFPFRYFADEYKLDYFAAFPGCSTEIEANPVTIGFLIRKVNEEKIPAVFHIELSNEKIANAICESTGARLLLFNSAHNLSKSDFDGGATYLDIMKQNAETLKIALEYKGSAE